MAEAKRKQRAKIKLPGPNRPLQDKAGLTGRLAEYEAKYERENAKLVAEKERLLKAQGLSVLNKRSQTEAGKAAPPPKAQKKQRLRSLSSRRKPTIQGGRCGDRTE